MLLMNVKGALDHVSKSCLQHTTGSMGADRDLMRWKKLFMSDKSVSLVIDYHQCMKTEVETGVPQRSPVSLILFAINLSAIFREIEKDVEG